jgi:hypothetical protein
VLFENNILLMYIGFVIEVEESGEIWMIEPK